jgi:hypothetical protein
MVVCMNENEKNEIHTILSAMFSENIIEYENVVSSY